MVARVLDRLGTGWQARGLLRLGLLPGGGLSSGFLDGFSGRLLRSLPGWLSGAFSGGFPRSFGGSLLVFFPAPLIGVVWCAPDESQYLGCQEDDIPMPQPCPFPSRPVRASIPLLFGSALLGRRNATLVSGSYERMMSPRSPRCHAGHGKGQRRR